jgi:hypothetical protein
MGIDAVNVSHVLAVYEGSDGGHRLNLTPRFNSLPGLNHLKSKTPVEQYKKAA